MSGNLEKSLGNKKYPQLFPFFSDFPSEKLYGV